MSFAALLTGAAAPKVVDAAKAIVAALEDRFCTRGSLSMWYQRWNCAFPTTRSGRTHPGAQCGHCMYVAKRNKTGLAIYNAYYDTTQQEHLSLLGELRRASSSRSFAWFTSRKCPLRSSNVSAVEALIRWLHPHKASFSRRTSFRSRRPPLHQDPDALGVGRGGPTVRQNGSATVCSCSFSQHLGARPD